jgi:hypothetical protein
LGVLPLGGGGGGGGRGTGAGEGRTRDARARAARRLACPCRRGPAPCPLLPSATTTTNANHPLPKKQAPPKDQVVGRKSGPGPPPAGCGLCRLQANGESRRIGNREREMEMGNGKWKWEIGIGTRTRNSELGTPGAAAGPPPAAGGGAAGYRPPATPGHRMGGSLRSGCGRWVRAGMWSVIDTEHRRLGLGLAPPLLGISQTSPAFGIHHRTKTMCGVCGGSQSRVCPGGIIPRRGAR